MSSMLRPVSGVFLVLLTGCRAAPRYCLKDLPLYELESIPEPSEREISEYYHFLDLAVFCQVGRVFSGTGHRESKNVDAFGRVPNSNWFTNRNSDVSLTTEEIVKGPNKGDGPDTSEMWEVIKGKTEGATPGFSIRDSRGDIYLIKFDAPANPELASSAEVISTEFLYAAGYNTPENYITVFSPQKLQVGEKAKFVDKKGVKRRMGQADLDTILAEVATRKDGTIRAMASKYLSGIPKGPFSFKGTRKDDPVDTIPHEDRRELRGLRVICSWLNHVDALGKNTLDMYVEENGKKHLKHFLIDFGTTLGSASTPPHREDVRFDAGHEYTFDVVEILKCLFTFGVYERSWEDAEPVASPSIGHFESGSFTPRKWKTYCPNPAFQKMTSLDGYWGAKIVAFFSDEQIEAVVKDMHYSDPAAEKYLVETLKQRRDKIVRYWYSRVNPLDNFTIVEDTSGRYVLDFKDLAVTAGIYSSGENEHRYRVYRHDFEEGPELLTEYASATCPLALDEVVEALDQRRNTPGQEKMDRYFFLEIESKRGKKSGWEKYVRVHLHNEESSKRFSIVGVEHEG